jgi:hypothetical protein
MQFEAEIGIEIGIEIETEMEIADCRLKTED